MNWSHPRFLFANLSLATDRIWLLAEDGGTFRMLQRKADKWIQRAMPWDAVALCGTTQPTLLLLIVGVNGDVMTASAAGFVAEKVQTPQSDPAKLGMLRDARFIGGVPHVVGMGRQVYRREADGRWTALGDTLRPARKVVSGFHGIDGFSPDHLLAVGTGGEIWRSVDGQWSQFDSPTTASLNAVRCLPDGVAYICGQSGVLLRLKGDVIEQIAKGSIKANLYGLAVFQSVVYVASQTQLFRLEGQDLVEVDAGAGEGFTSGQLEVQGDTMWSVGAHHLATTADGAVWQLQMCSL
jgi:hypothetical protein